MGVSTWEDSISGECWDIGNWRVQPHELSDRSGCWLSRSWAMVASKFLQLSEFLTVVKRVDSMKTPRYTNTAKITCGISINLFNIHMNNFCYKHVCIYAWLLKSCCFGTSVFHQIYIIYIFFPLHLEMYELYPVVLPKVICALTFIPAARQRWCCFLVCVQWKDPEYICSHCIIHFSTLVTLIVCKVAMLWMVLTWSVKF